MKLLLSGLVCCALVSALPARAAEAEKVPAGKSDQQVKLDQAIAQQQAEVHQLQGDVAREESRTHDADEKLKQQDQAIADLKRQLEALKAAPKGASHP